MNSPSVHECHAVPCWKESLNCLCSHDSHGVCSEDLINKHVSVTSRHTCMNCMLIIPELFDKCRINIIRAVRTSQIGWHVFREYIKIVVVVSTKFSHGWGNQGIWSFLRLWSLDCLNPNWVVLVDQKDPSNTSFASIFNNLPSISRTFSPTVDDGNGIPSRKETLDIAIEIVLILKELIDVQESVA